LDARRVDPFEHNPVRVRAEIRAGFAIEKPSEFVIAHLVA
jgi:hypothetical protein